jgi:hypothetical protein
MMAAIVFLALALAVIVQTIRLNQALVRERQHRAEAEFARVRVERAEYARMLSAAQAEWQRQEPPPVPKPQSVKSDEMSQRPRP